ncbi:MAG: hypothetical protein ABR543_15355 [Gemmatimonadaceae bacterium]
MRMKYSRIVLICFTMAVVPLTGACPIGTTVRRYEPARGPKGIFTSIQLTGKSAVSGEVLEVRTDALLVRASVGSGIVLVPLKAIRRARFKGVAHGINDGGWRGLDTQNAVRLSSRFPYGLAEEHLQKLLAETGQSAPLLMDK